MSVSLTFGSAKSKKKPADVLLIPCFKGKKEAEPVVSQKIPQAALKDFEGKLKSHLLLYNEEIPEKRQLFIGLGPKDKITKETLRRAFTHAASHCLANQYTHLNILFPSIKELSEEEVSSAIVEGLLLHNYSYEALLGKTKKEKSKKLISSIHLVGCNKKAFAAAEVMHGICEGNYLARDLVNGNADDITPVALANAANKLAKGSKNTKATIFDEKKIAKLGMGLLHAVSRGSQVPPRFIILEYKGAPSSKDHTVIVGKGVTYDTGGLDIKPAAGMLTMKRDMAGAAAALGVIAACQATKLKKNVTAVIPATENSVDGFSYKPGDVYKAYSGHTVEIGNTDAEGRLILADALAYTVEKLKPTRIIDFATLTGAIIIALGRDISGLMGNNDKLADALYSAGKESGEQVWRLPLEEDHKRHLKSDIADLNNVGGREGASMTAALFLQEFVGKTPWAHIDIAGSAYLDRPFGSQPKHATGIGVRLILEFLKSH